MKKKIQSIAIKNPCTESWDDMQPSAAGRYCDSCRKNVIDFIGLSNQQILNQIAGQSRLCGKFNDTQLIDFNRYLAEARQPGFSWKRLGLAAALFSFLPFVKAEAQVKTLTESRAEKTKRAFHHHKKVDFLVGKSLLPKDIKDELEFPPIVQNHDLQTYQEYLTGKVGGLSIRYSFPRRLWYDIRWKIKLILGK